MGPGLGETGGEDGEEGWRQLGKCATRGATQLPSPPSLLPIVYQCRAKYLNVVKFKEKYSIRVYGPSELPKCF